MVELNRVEITGIVRNLDSDATSTKREHTYRKFTLEHKRTFKGKTYTHEFPIATWDEDVPLLKKIHEGDHVLVIGRIRTAFYTGEALTEIIPEQIIKLGK